MPLFVGSDNRVTSLDALMILQAAAGTPAKVITWYSYEEGMGIAGAQNKTVMIEVYAIWCEWCKEMDRVIYTDPDVIDLADQFVCIKIADSDGFCGFQKMSEETYSSFAPSRLGVSLI
ncbi:MAG: thioredoxin family protein [Euryarchaeota archaeon]|nr:thioredoxin family protein [Euryarchaeota archaeon]